MHPKEILNRRHELAIEWCEPWQGCSTSGKECDVHVTFRTSVDGCIALQRKAWAEVGYTKANTASEEDAITEFIVVHWATVVKL